MRALDDLVSRGHCALCRLLQLAGLEDHEGARRGRTPRVRRVSKRCRPIIRSPAAISNAKSCRCSKIRKSACSSGARSQADCSPANSDRAAMGPKGTPHGIRFPACRQRPRLEMRRSHARRSAKDHGVSVARVALAYVLAKPFVTSVIIGAKTDGTAGRQSRSCEALLSARRDGETRRR